MPKGILERLAEGVVLGDGGYLLKLEKRGYVQAGPSRAAMADFAVQARDLGVNYIGSCCGSVAAHVRAMAVALGKRPANERDWRSKTGKPMSAYEYHGHSEQV